MKLSILISTLILTLCASAAPVAEPQNTLHCKSQYVCRRAKGLQVDPIGCLCCSMPSNKACHPPRD